MRGEPVSGRNVDAIEDGKWHQESQTTCYKDTGIQGYKDARWAALSRMQNITGYYGAGGLKFYILEDAAPPSTRLQDAEFSMDPDDIEKKAEVTVPGFAAKRKKKSSSPLLDMDSASNLEGSFLFFNFKSSKNEK